MDYKRHGPHEAGRVPVCVRARGCSGNAEFTTIAPTHIRMPAPLPRAHAGLNFSGWRQ